MSSSSRPPDTAAILRAALDHLDQCRTSTTAVSQQLDLLGDLTALPARVMSAQMVGMGRMRVIHAMLDEAEQTVRNALAPRPPGSAEDADLN